MRYTIFLLSIISLFFFNSCSKYDDLDKLLDSPSTKMAALAVFNTVPNSLDMEVFIDDRKVKAANESLHFGDYLPYKSIFSGKAKIKIVSSYKNGKDTYDGTVDLAAGRVYSLFVNKAEKLTVKLVEDDVIRPRRGFAKIRIAHMSPDAASLSLNENEGRRLFQNIKYKDVTSFVEIKSSSNVSLQVQPIGASKMPQLDQNFQPVDQGIYTLLVTGYVDSDNQGEEIGMQLIKH